MKGLITVCSECGTKTELQEITIEFERKGVRAAMSGIPAMVCPNCGEQYVPGDIAGDVIDIVSLIIDETEELLKRTEARRRKLLLDWPAIPPKRLELALIS
ncbi:MAG TPA: YgiT-type zinc finger protein [Anaerolineae bacterium]|nr:YgiT-type zinc finger protein [Anaerolineae bacterium]